MSDTDTDTKRDLEQEQRLTLDKEGTEMARDALYGKAEPAAAPEPDLAALVARLANQYKATVEIVLRDKHGRTIVRVEGYCAEPV